MQQQMMALGVNLGESQEARNRALVTQMVAHINAGDVAGSVAAFAEEVVNHGFRVPREVIRMILQDINDTFPDLVMEPLETVAEGEWVTVRMWFGGTHLGVSRFPVNSGVLLGVPPTGRAFRCQHIHLFRFRDGKIVEHYACREDVEMARQLGVLPPLPPMPDMPPAPGVGSSRDAVERQVALAA